MDRFFLLNHSFYYIELNTFLIGTFISFFKYKLNSFYFFFIDSRILYCHNYYLFRVDHCYWKKVKLLLLKFIRSHLYYNIKHLKLEGRGYKLYYYYNTIIFKLGYSHLCYFLLPIDTYFYSRQKKTYYRIVSFSDSMLGNLLFRMKCFRIPNKYKKKGIFIV